MPRLRKSNVLALPVRSDSHWVVDEETGRLLPPLRIRRFLEWFIDPRRPVGETISQWADANGVDHVNVRKWLQDPRFRDLLDERCGELNVRADRTQAVIEAMWLRAVAGNVEAAKLYLTYVGKMTQRVEHHHTVDVRTMSNEQLQAELARLQLERGQPTVIDAEVVDDGD